VFAFGFVLTDKGKKFKAKKSWRLISWSIKKMMYVICFLFFTHRRDLFFKELAEIERDAAGAQIKGHFPTMEIIRFLVFIFSQNKHFRAFGFRVHNAVIGYPGILVESVFQPPVFAGGGLVFA
jgi:hypothetical protein